jgi:hypothetical protein
MHQINHDKIKWSKADGKHSPRTVGTFCPHCGEKVKVSFPKADYDSKRHTSAATGTCPDCDGTVQVWTINADAKDTDNCVVTMYPSPLRLRTPLPETDHAPERIRNTFESAITEHTESVVFPYSSAVAETNSYGGDRQCHAVIKLIMRQYYA